MDWIGLVIFILVMVFRALGESEKQKKQREARQRQKPPSGPTTKRVPAPPPLEAPRPVAKRELDLPPVFPFPLFELFEEDEDDEPEDREIVKEAVREVFQDAPAAAAFAQPVMPEEPAKPASTTTAGPRRAAPEPVLPGLQLSRAAEGVVWAEILGPPRALRPFRR